MRYTRIYSDHEGESHFEEIGLDLASAEFASPAPSSNLTSPVPCDRMILAIVEAEVNVAFVQLARQTGLSDSLGLRATS